MRKYFNKLKEEYRLTAKENFLKGIYWGFLILALIALSIGAFYFRTGLSPWLQVVAYAIVGILAFNIFRWLGALAHSIFKGINGKFISLLLALLATLLLAEEMRFSWPNAIYNKSLIIAILSALAIGGGLYAAIKQKSGRALFLMIVLIGSIATYFFLQPILKPGDDPYPIEVGSFYPNQGTFDINLGNPGTAGDFEFDYFTYGSGSDERRPEFGVGVKYKTPPVNGLPLLPEWTGKRKKWRERYWGFGIENAPLNGRVWMPTSGEKLPLILVVHGNHGMEHHSDPGYQYLGEHLASRGFVTVSVDENFINGTWSGDFRGREMPARAWFLLKHLEQWRSWSQDESSPLFNKVDLNKVILMGHSRGGEAVSIAAAYNQLNHFPDNAAVEFDFNFGIQGLVTIAPTDARYFRRIALKNINYLSLQGTYDADEASFFGLRQYQRIHNSDTSHYLKAGVLIHKANHGQFNSIWGSRDFGEPYGWFLNTGALISGEDQRKAAKVFIGAFAERVFNEKSYDPIFEQPYLVKDWLPETVMLGNYEAAKTQYLIDFEQDIDLINDEHVSISANQFITWREEELSMRGGETQGTNALILGWDQDSLANPVYKLTLKDSMLLQNDMAFTLSLGRTDSKEIQLKGDENIDFRIELITNSDTLQLGPLSKVKKPAPLLKVDYMKLDKMNASFGKSWELNMETAAFPLNLTTENPVWLKQLRFIFDQSPKGQIALDNIGFRQATRSEEK
jgi:hypothetical protein